MSAEMTAPAAFPPPWIVHERSFFIKVISININPGRSHCGVVWG
jgi:hypothetical protein